MLDHLVKCKRQIKDVELLVQLSKDSTSVMLNQKTWPKLKVFLPSDIESWDLQKLWLYTTGDKHILPSLLNIQFDHLQSISMTCNNIESIQCLTYLKAPFLKTLIANDNKINRIRSLARINTKWECLDLTNNMLISLDDLSLCDFPSLLENLCLQFHSGANQINRNLNPLLKCCFTQFLTIRLTHSDERLNKKVVTILLSKMVQKRRLGRNFK